MTTLKQVLTPEFRLSFADLFEPKVDMEDDNGSKAPKFRAEMLFPKSIRMSELAQMRALHDSKLKPEWISAKLEYRTFNQCFLDGDKKKQASRHNHWFTRASSGADYPPTLLLPNRLPVTRRGDLYLGCFCRAILTAYPWEHKNKQGHVIKRGVSFNLDTVIKVRDGERIGGGGVSEQEREALLSAIPMPEADADDLLG